MEDFVNAIAHEVKQEIANRYFGFRTRIEIEVQDYLKRLLNAHEEISARIHLDLLRMQFLLHQQQLFKTFLVFTGLPDTSCPKLPPPLVDLFTEFKGDGFTRWRRYRNLAFRVYQSLADNVAAYRETYFDLKEEYDEICYSINEFHRNNDLTGILSFLRTFDSTYAERSKFFPVATSPFSESNLDQDLRIPLPSPVDRVMSLLAAIPPLKHAKKPMTVLLKKSFPFHHNSPQKTLPF